MVIVSIQHIPFETWCAVKARYNGDGGKKSVQQNPHYSAANNRIMGANFAFGDT